ncbi:MAG: phosphatidylglycerophosphatase A [Burkholderiales bacterium]
MAEINGRDGPILRPTVAFMRSHRAHVIALGFGTGLSRFAPGTVGTMLAFPIYWLATTIVPPWVVLAAVPLLFALGVWACGVTGHGLGIHDHSGMNFDEIVAMLLILVFTPSGWIWQALAFFAFRFFDVVKPPPVRYYDQSVKGGFGVMLDDILAAGYTLLTIALVKYLVG